MCLSVGSPPFRPAAAWQLSCDSISTGGFPPWFRLSSILLDASGERFNRERSHNLGAQRGVEIDAGLVRLRRQSPYFNLAAPCLCTDGKHLNPCRGHNLFYWPDSREPFPFRDKSCNVRSRCIFHI